MNKRHLATRTAVGALAATALTAALAAAAPGTAQAAPPEHLSTTESGHEVWGSCGPGDDLVADYVLSQDITMFDETRGTLHLQLVGRLTRTGTGVVGTYAERQRDFALVDGSERYVGLLGHLVVPGGGGFTLAGHARQSADGTLTTTPGLAPLLTLDFEEVVCAALAR
jgi:hypothetical protein